MRARPPDRAVVILRALVAPGSFFVDVFDDLRLTGYREKPETTYYVSMGIYVYEPHVLRFIQPGKYLDFPDLVLKLIKAGEKVCALPCDCLWLDIGRPDDYAKAQELFAERRKALLTDEPQDLDLV